jgi:anti-anti-sigma regulatory factor
MRLFDRYVICGSDPDIKATHAEAVTAVSRHIRIKPHVSDNVFRSTSLPHTAEDGVGIALAESEENPLPAASVVARAYDPDDAGAPLKITGEQTIRTADQLHKLLAEHLDRGVDFLLDLSEVVECDAAALQLIYALRQSAVQRKQRFQITSVSPAITETAAALGLQVEALITSCGAVTEDGDCKAAGKHNGI